jgi:hypothetical protein
MNILAWYRNRRHLRTLRTLNGGSIDSNESVVEYRHQEPMAVHLSTHSAPLLTPWQVLTQLTAIHLHHTPGVLLGGHDSMEVGGQFAIGLDAAHFMGGVASHRNSSAILQHMVSEGSVQRTLS